MLKASSWGALVSRRPALLIVVLLFADVTLAVIFGLARSIDIPTLHLDGAYQTASGLYRLADGQWPGKDFYPYLGMGPTYFLYSIFVLAGGHVAASVFAAHVATACAAGFSVGLIGALTARSQRVLTGVLLGSLFLCTVIFLYPKLPPQLIERLTPGNSLRPIRAFVPYLSAVAAWVLLSLRLGPAVMYSLIGVVAGATALWSNDFGVPTAMLLLLLSLLWAFHTGDLSLKVGAACLGAALLVASIGLAVATNGHGIDLLKYSFVDVRHDQYWYFGPWLPEFRVFSFSDLIEKLFLRSYFEGYVRVRPEIDWWGLVLVWVGLITIRKPSLENFLLLFLGLSLLGGGLVATVGGHRAGYLTAFIFWCQVTFVTGAAALLLRAAIRIVREAHFEQQWIARAGIAVSGVLLLALLFIAIWSAAVDYRAARKEARTDPHRFLVPELGGYLPVEWKSHIDRARASKDTLVLEEYWGLRGSVTRKHGAVPVDSVIHALGATRSTFGDAIRRLPELVITTPRSASPEWQPWNVSFNWWFYQPLLQNYRPTKTSPTTLVWEKTRTSQATIWPEANCKVAASAASPGFIVSAPSEGYYEVTLDYQFDRLSSTSLLLVRNDLNYAAGGGGYISLDPRASASTFPVAIFQPGESIFDFRLVTAKDDFSRLRIHRCAAKKILFEDKEVLPDIRSIRVPTNPQNITDNHFDRGIGRYTAAIIVENGVDARARLLPGVVVKFIDGTSKMILSQFANDENLTIRFLGPTLDADKVGFPRPFEIQR